LLRIDPLVSIYAEYNSHLIMHASTHHHANSWFRSRAGKRYGLQLASIIVLKLMLIALLYALFIAPHPRADTSPEAIRARLTDAAQASGDAP
jgi:hypothetical protein